MSSSKRIRKATDQVTGEVNQCDGCRRGLPVERGLHIDENCKGWGRVYMCCVKKDYLGTKEETLIGY